MLLFCKEAAAGPDGRLNIQGVFNELYASDFPARQEHLVLAGVIEWERHTQGRIPFKIDLTGPDGKSVFSIDGHTDVEFRPVNSAPAKTQLVLPMEEGLNIERGKEIMWMEALGRYKIIRDH